MKILWEFVAPTVKAIVGVCSLLVGMGWAAFASVQLIVTAESASLRTEFDGKMHDNIAHIDKRFDDTHAMLREIKEDIKRMR